MAGTVERAGFRDLRQQFVPGPIASEVVIARKPGSPAQGTGWSVERSSSSPSRSRGTRNGPPLPRKRDPLLPATSRRERKSPSPPNVASMEVFRASCQDALSRGLLDRTAIPGVQDRSRGLSSELHRLALLAGRESYRERAEGILAAVAGLMGDRLTACVCRNFTCSLPVTTQEELRAQVGRRR